MRLKEFQTVVVCTGLMESDNYRVACHTAVRHERRRADHQLAGWPARREDRKKRAALFCSACRKASAIRARIWGQAIWEIQRR